jgi:hypothetical protein
MVIEYVADVSCWEAWRQQYQYGVLLILPPDPPKNKVNDLRTKYDPKGQSICQAHISLTVPVPRSLNDTYLEELQEIASDIKPFSIHCRPLINYLPHPGVCRLSRRTHLMDFEPNWKLHQSLRCSN